MHIQTIRLLSQNTAALNAEFNEIKKSEPVSLAICFGTFTAIEALSQANELGAVAENWLAGSSCLGCSDQFGINSELPNSATLFLLNDKDGHYGVGSADLADDIRTSASDALEQAMEKAGKPNELPALIWCLQAPGNEEQVLAGLQDLVGNEVPIFGGSSADNDVAGDWLQYDGNVLYSNGVVILALYPSTPLSSYFSSGYSASTWVGTVTAVDGRNLQSIDNKPAASVYNDWLVQEGKAPLQEGNILMESAFSPLGRIINHDKNVSINLLSHPANFNEDQSLSLFSEVQEGEQLWLMNGDKTQLIKRAADVVKIAKDNLNFQYDCEPAGALIVYCAGCMLAVKEDLDEVQQAIKNELGDIPFIVTFTFGEQGCFVDGSSRHGNLMISAIMFGASDADK
jgi:hypothetical protein